MTASVELVCPRCTRTISLEGPIRDALHTAESLGWKPDGEQAVCPKCPGSGLGRIVIGEPLCPYPLP